MNNRKRQGLGITLGFLGLVALSQPGWALMQTDFKFLGVSTDLNKLGVVETWTSDGSGQPNCEVRLYQQGHWRPKWVKAVKPEEKHPEAQCKALQEDLVKKHKLQTINWQLAEMTPRPSSVKDSQGRLKSENPLFATRYPAFQVYNFTLPPSGDWQIALENIGDPNAYQRAFADNPDELPPSQASYSMVIRPKSEPFPFASVQAPYEDYHFFLAPIKVMTNSEYGLVAIIFRDYARGFEGFDYYYRPFFIRWPEYQAMTPDQAKTALIKATQYAMEPNIMVKGPNSLNPSYRAFLRLKSDPMTEEDILTALAQSSPAGKLYWMALLYDQNPQQYQAMARQFVQQATAPEVIQSKGQAWEPRSFQEILRQQAMDLQVIL